MPGSEQAESQYRTLYLNPKSARLPNLLIIGNFLAMGCGDQFATMLESRDFNNLWIFLDPQMPERS